MTETRYLPATHTPIVTPTSGAIVPVSSEVVSIEKFAQDTYLALPPEHQNQASWAELQEYVRQKNWEELELIYNSFSTSTNLQVTDNSSRQQFDRHDQHSYSDSRSVSHTDDRSWEMYETDVFCTYTDNSALDYYHDSSEVAYTDNRSWIDNRSWEEETYTDSRQFVDNSSYSYAPEVNHHYYVDNSIYLNVDIDGSFNGNGNGSGNSSSFAQLPAGKGDRCCGDRGDGEWPLWDRILGMLVITLCCILAVGIWRGGMGLIRQDSTYYQPMEVR